MNQNKKILMILLNSFENDSRVLKEATSLVKAGYLVTIACLYKKGLKRNENLNGIEVQRIGSKGNNGTHQKTIATKLYQYIKFFITILLLYRDTHLIHCHDLQTLPLGVLIKWLSLNKKKVIYDAHEYETEVGFAVTGITKKIYEATERFFIKFADAVITVSDSIANEYVRLYNIPKPYLVLNCPRYLKNAPKKDLFRQKFNLSDKQMILLYQGALFEGRGISLLLKAFTSLKSTSHIIIFMGYGPLKDVIKEAASKHDNIFYHEAVAPEQLLKYTASADMGVSWIENSCLSYYYCLPNKLFEYIQAGVPVLVSDLYEIKKIITKYHNGIVVKETLQDLIATIQNLSFDDINSYKTHIEKAKKIFTWERQERTLLDIYKTL